MTNVFNHLEYKEYIYSEIEQNSSVHGYKGRLAKAAGCQLSFLSKVLHQETHITLEHALGMANFWSFSSLQKEYFLELVHLARAGTPELQDHVRLKIKALKKANENLADRFDRPDIPSKTDQLIYYSSHLYATIHLLTGVQEFASSTAIAKRLKISVRRAEHILSNLKTLGLVSETERGLERSQSFLHLPKQSELNAVNHSNWRNLALQNIQRDDNHSLHYSGAHTLSRADYEKIKTILLASIDRCHEVITLSKDEDVFCMNIDLFRI